MLLRTNRMAFAVLSLISMFGLAGCGSSSAKSVEDLLKPFSGEWTVVSVNRSGQPVTAAGLKDFSVVLDQGKMTLVQVRGSVGGSGPVMAREVISEEFILQVDPAQPMGEINLAHANGEAMGLVRPALYEFAENQLKLCYAEPNRPRPTSLAPGEKLTLLVLARKQ